MAQSIGIAYGDSLTSKAFNDKISSLVGGNVVYSGYNITAGTGKAINIVRGTDNVSALIINGVNITEDADLSNILTIPDNTSGSTRTDIVVAKYVHGNGATCSYSILTGTTTAPDSTYCILATLSVPNNFTAASSVTITIPSKMLPLNKLNGGVNADTTDGYHAATASTASTLATRDASGNITAKQFISDVAAGTAPMTVTSTTKVANLNADQVDGYNLNQGVQTTDSPTFAKLTLSQATGTAPMTVTSTTKVTNLNADKVDDMDAATASTASTVAARDASGNLTAKQLVSDVAAGTAPMTVTSTTVVTNLNADLHDGYHAGNASGNIPVSNGTVNTNLNADMVDGLHTATASTASTVAARDASGNLTAKQLVSDIVTGTAPLTVSSTTKVTNLNVDQVDGYDAGNASGNIPVSNGTVNTNLNADMVDGLHTATGSTASTVAARDTSGNISAKQFVSDVATGTAPLSVASTTKVTNLNVDQVDGYDLDQDVKTTASPTHVKMTLTQATGTAPLTVTSTTKVTNLNVDQVDGYDAGNASGNIPVSNGTVNTNLNADMVDGLHTATASTASTVAARDASGNLTAKQLVSDVAAGTAPLTVTSTTKVTNLNVDQVDGYDAGNASGNIPVSNGTVNTNLNADMVDGLHTATASTASTVAARDASGNLTAKQLVSDIADGTTPMTITSKTKVVNLNVDQVDGYDLDQDVKTTASPTHVKMTLTQATGTAPMTVSSTTKVANLNADKLDDMETATASTASTVAARDASGNLTAKQLVSDVAVGTAPLTVTSTTVVTNLNADMVDGYNLNQGVQTTDSPSFAKLTLSQATGTAPMTVSSTTVVTNLNSDKLDGYDAGNANGNIPVSNGTVNTNLNADMVDGLHTATGSTASTVAARDASGNIAAKQFVSDIATGTAPMTVASTTKVTSLNVDQVDGYDLDQDVKTTASPSHVKMTLTQATGTAPMTVSSTTVVTNLNSDLHDGYHAGNASGNIPVSNGTVNTNLNADMVDGLHTATASTASTVAARDASGNLTAKQLVSDVAVGTAPLTVTSTTKVTNLNVDQVDGYDAGNASGNIPVSNGTVNTNLNADMVDGKHASDFTPFATMSAATAAAAGYYRIATSASGIGSNSAIFKVDFSGTGVVGRVLFAASCQNGATTGTVINQLGYTASDYSKAITKVRVVYNTTATGNYAYIEVYNPTALALTLTVDLIDTTGWSLVTPSTAGSIPTGYTSKELTLDAGFTTLEDITTASRFISNVATGTAPLVVSSTTKVTNLNADKLDDMETATASTASTVVARDASGNLTAKQLVSDIATGTAPMTVTSTTKVTNLNVDQVDGYDAGNANGNIPVSNGTVNTNLNADMVDGLHTATASTASTVAARDASGNITAKQLVSDVAAGTAPLTVTSTTKVTNLNVDQVDGYDLDQDIKTTASPSHVKMTLTQATGTAPLTVSSTTKVTNLNVDQVDGYDAGNASGNIPVSNGTVNTNLNADMVDGLHTATASTASTVAARDASGNITAKQLVSDVAAGTAPLTVTSTTKVVNLNVDQVDGYDLDQDVKTTASPTHVKMTLTQATGTAPLTVTSTTKVTNLNVDQVDGYDAGNASGNIPVSNGTVNTNLNADMVDGLHTATASTASTVAVRDASGNLTAKQLVLDVAAGTAPLTVTSTTKVTNLNADMVDGYSLNQGVQTTDSPTFAKLTLSQATGTAPMTVTSTTKVTNLNADMVDGISFTSGLDSAKPAATGSGNIYLATDTQVIYRDDSSSTWKTMGGGVVLTSYFNTVTLAADSATATIGVPYYDKTRDTMLVTINGAAKYSGQDYTISSDSKTITKISDDRGANWDAGTTINFVVLGTAATQPDQLGNICIATSYTATADGTTNVPINNQNFNSTTDTLIAYFLGNVAKGEVRSTRLFAGTDKNYVINANNTSIDLQGWSINTGEVIQFEVWKKVRTSDSTSGITAARLNDAARARNMFQQALINGNFDIWQRGTSLSISSNGGRYICDRWKLNTYTASGSFPSVTHSQGSLNLGEISNSRYFYRITTTGNMTSLGAGDYLYLGQCIEKGVRFLCSANGNKITVSFYARSSIANKKVMVYIGQNYGTGGSPSATNYSNAQEITLTSTWTKNTLTFDTIPVTGKTFGTNEDDIFVIYFEYTYGSNEASSMGVTTSGENLGSGTIDFAQVQLNMGDEALSFHPKSYGQELIDCMRYYQKFSNQGSADASAYRFGTGFCYSASSAQFIMDLSIPMRIRPTVTFPDPLANYCIFDNGGVNLNLSGINVIYSTTQQFGFNATSTATTLSGGHATNFSAVSTASATITCDAEI